MRISSKDWKNYIEKLSKLNNTAGEKMSDYVTRHGFDDPKIIDYAYGLVTKYGEGSASLSAMMYDAIAEMEGKILPPAEVAETPEYGEVAKAVNGVRKHSQNPTSYGNVVNRLVKRTGADTMLKNAERDGAEFAWIPSGDTCAFCIALASRGWQHISKKSLKNGHAEHIHANCDCNYTVRFDGSSSVAGYNPDEYLEIYENAEGNTPEEKINSIRAKYRAENKDKINAQKRAAYAERMLEQEKKGKINDHSIDKDVIGTKEYRDKFSELTSDSNINKKLYNKAIDILNHRNGTDYEDMHLISVNDSLVKGSQTKVEYYDLVPEEKRHLHVWYNESLNSAIKNNPAKTLISIHNHPNSLPPSGGDFESQFNHGYKFGIISCHNGDIYYYEIGKKRFSGLLYDLTVDKYKKQGYSELEAYNMTLEQFEKDYGIKWRKL